jgi:hypothetical protein
MLAASSVAASHAFEVVRLNRCAHVVGDACLWELFPCMPRPRCANAVGYMPLPIWGTYAPSLDSPLHPCCV